MSKLLTLIAMGAIVASPALAQENGWSGEGSASAGFTTGNTETTDIGIGLALSRKALWSQSVTLSADYGETDGIENKNRVLGAYELSRDLNPRLFGFGRGSYEIDDFSGFDSRAFVGGGLGYRAIMGERTNWTLQGGPGFRVDELSTGESEESFAIRASSDFAHSFNDAVDFTNLTEINYAEISTQILNTAALTAKLSDKLAARASFEVRHELDPLPGRDATDTATRLSLVYAF
jgi:putative salt-induced outer membrane protein